MAIVQRGFVCVRQLISEQLMPLTAASVERESVSFPNTAPARLGLPSECLPQLIDLAAKYAAQTVETNVALSACGSSV